MPKSVILLIPIIENKNTRICFAFLPRRDNGQSGRPLAFCQRIASMLHIVLIMFLVLSAYPRVSNHISGPKRPLPVKTIQTIISQVYMHKL